ncbi:hypothetical protein [Galbibacter sp. BG1]
MINRKSKRKTRNYLSVSNIIFVLIPLIATLIYAFCGWVYTYVTGFKSSSESMYTSERQLKARKFFLMLSTPFYPLNKIVEKYEALGTERKYIDAHFGMKRYYPKLRMYGFVGGTEMNLYSTIEAIKENESSN